MKDISLHILDIVQNSTRAKATEIEVQLEEKPAEDQLILTIKDNGSGIAPEMLKTITDPYTTSRTSRKVGMGLSLLRQNTELSEGHFSIGSELGKGTELSAAFGLSHIDRPPLGDIEGTMALIISSHPEINIIYKHICPGGEVALSTAELKEQLEGVPLSHPEVIRFIKEFLKENLQEIKAAR